MTQENEFNVGDKVILHRSYAGSYGYKIGFVGKVYKNGNFVLTGDTQQYRQSGRCAGEYCYGSFTAYKYTEKNYNKLVYPVELKAKKAQVLKELENIDLKNLTLEDLDRISNIIKGLGQ